MATVCRRMRTYGSAFNVRRNVLRNALTFRVRRGVVLLHVELEVVDVQKRRVDLGVRNDELTTTVDSLAMLGIPSEI